MKSQELKNIKFPDSAGVYLFKNKGNVLYIGRGTSLKERVKSYFSNDLIETRGPLLVDMVYKADDIDFIKTDSVLEAIILEANLIKKYQPKYNTKEKDNKSFNYVVITKEVFSRILIVRGRDIEKGLPFEFKNKFGPFINGGYLKNALKIIRKIFPFRDNCEPNIGKPCFNRQLGLCPGVCDGTINVREYSKIIKKICLLFKGKIGSLKLLLKKEMNILSDSQEYEKANIVKKQIFSLEHISDVSLINTEYTEVNNDSLRIEAYDMAHLAGTNNVGVMVVMENGEFKKSEYKKFIINNSKGDDIGALIEVLTRRFKHQEWRKPDYIVVDGGLAQFNTAKKFIKNISIIAVTKDDKHKAKVIIGDKGIIGKYKKNILLINNEAHRFAISFHRQRRSAII